MKWFSRLFPALLLVCGVTANADKTVEIVLETTLGDIEAELFVEKAPLSAGSFLKFLDEGRYDGEGFYRVVRPDNDNGDPVITVIQGGLLEDGSPDEGDQVSHETTQMTGLKHTDGVLSLARSAPGTGSGAAFFICIGDQPSLDYSGLRNRDGEGFAAFGRVTSGMDVVKAINAQSETQIVDDPYVAGQILTDPVIIRKAYRR